MPESPPSPSLPLPLPRPLILASTSKYRRALLERLRVPFTCVAPDVDERAAEPQGVPCEQKVRVLARLKAEAVARLHPGACVLGSDQGAELDGELLHKPGTAQNAEEQLRRLSGRAHRLLTAVTLRTPDGSLHEHLDIHVMHVRALTPAEIRRYVAHDAPLDCAGSYKIESLGVALLERVEGEDFTGIEGLPLIATSKLLRAQGYEVP